MTFCRTDGDQGAFYGGNFAGKRGDLKLSFSLHHMHIQSSYYCIYVYTYIIYIIYPQMHGYIYIYTHTHIYGFVQKCVIAQFIAIIFADKTNTIEDNKKDNKSTHVSFM